MPNLKCQGNYGKVEYCFTQIDEEKILTFRECSVFWRHCLQEKIKDYIGVTYINNCAAIF